MKNLILIFQVLLVVAIARADTWSSPPELVVISSPDGSALLRIKSARALVLRFDTAKGEYRKVAEFELRNHVAPNRAVITNDARFVVTFDDWAELGRTENVVVVYRGSGQVVRAWSLTDIFSAEEIKTFESSTSSTWWRGDIELTEKDGLSPLIAINLGDGAKPVKGRTPGYPYYFDVEQLKFIK